MKEKLGVAVIGVGTFGSLHARVYSQMDGCRLVAVSDLNPKRLDQVATALGVEGIGDYRELLQRSDVGAVSICVTDELHVAPALAAAAAGKHLLIEKPLAMTPGDCDQIIAAANVAGVKLMVGQILRYDPRYAAARAAIRAGRIGELVHLSTRRNNPIANARRLVDHTNVVHFLGVHDIDLLNWCLGAKPCRVVARATAKVLKTTMDTVLAIITYPDGTPAALEVSWVLPASHPGGLDARFEAVGTAGVVYVNGGYDAVEIAAERYERPQLAYAPDVYAQTVGILRDELADFVRSVVDDRPPTISGEDAKAAVAVAWAIQQSLATGSEVEVP